MSRLVASRSVTLNEFPSRFDIGAHQDGEDPIRLDAILNGDLLQDAPLGIHGRFEQLRTVSLLAQALVAIQLDVLLAKVLQRCNGCAKSRLRLFLARPGDDLPVLGVATQELFGIDAKLVQAQQERLHFALKMQRINLDVSVFAHALGVGTFVEN